MISSQGSSTQRPKCSEPMDLSKPHAVYRSYLEKMILPHSKPAVPGRKKRNKSGILSCCRNQLTTKFPKRKPCPACLLTQNPHRQKHTRSRQEREIEHNNNNKKERSERKFHPSITPKPNPDAPQTDVLVPAPRSFSGLLIKLLFSPCGV